MNEPLISVILPSYNHARWIGESIESVLNQTYQNFELLIVDDGSQDNSADIIKRYAKQDNRIRYDILPTNVGACSAAKKIHDISRGEYSAIIGSDDIWYPEKLTKQMAFMQENPQYGAIFALPDYIDEDSKLITPKFNEFAISAKNRTRFEWLNYFFHQRNPLCHPTNMIKKTCYQKAGYFNPVYRSLPDLDMWVRICFHDEIYVMNEKLIQYRRHGYNESAKSASNMMRVYVEYQHLLNHYLDNIRDVETLQAIFPGVACDDAHLIPFFIAKEALKSRFAFAKSFGLQILLTEMEKEDVAQLLIKKGIYSYKMLSEDCGSYNIFNRPGIAMRKHMADIRATFKSFLPKRIMG